jgi:hypothetical protein
VNPVDIRVALEKAAYDVLSPLGVEFSAKNRKFEPKGREIWARVTARFGVTKTLELGDDAPLGIRNGNLTVQIFILPNTDVSVGEEVCVKLEEAFRHKNLECVHCGEPYTEEIGLDGDQAWFQLNVNVPFWTWIGQ